MSTPLPPGFTATADTDQPRPRPVPVAPAVVVHHHGAPAWLVLIAALAAGAALGAWRLVPTPAPEPNAAGVRVGRKLVPALAEALAKGCDAAAAQLDAGQTVGAADEALKKTFDSERKAAFATLGGPYLATIVHDGEEPKSDAVRRAFADAHRAIARGLRNGR